MGHNHFLQGLLLMIAKDIEKITGSRLVRTGVLVLEAVA
jgi:hypothetical protein